MFRKEFTDQHPELFKDAANVTDLVSGLLSKNKNAVLREGMSPEEMDAYRKLHGIPEKSTDYPFEGLSMFDQPKAQQIAYEAGLSKIQAKALEKWAKQMEKDTADRVDSEKNTMKAEARQWLTNTYGLNAESQLRRAFATMTKYASEDFVKEVTLSGLGNSKHFISMLLNFANVTSESTETNVGGIESSKSNFDPINNPEDFSSVIFPQ